MKKSTIWSIAVVMGISFLTLLYLQARYFEQVVNMRKEQFNENVMRSLYQTARNLELNETHELLRRQMGDTATTAEKAKGKADTLAHDTFSHQMENGLATSTPKVLFTSYQPKDNKDSEALKKKVRERYIYQKGLLEEEVYSILYEPSTLPMGERLAPLEGELDRSLHSNGIGTAMTYHYFVTNSVGDTIAICPDYDAKGDAYTFRQELFPNDASSHKAVLYIHFPELKDYIFSGVRFMIPAIIFTLVLLCMFIFTIYTIFRQKRLTEIKNDFINNMTHEFKTPISTISLAAQMLQDPAVGKSETMFKHISGIINDETKRLRFQVEKVLQMSMFDKKAGTFNRKEMSMNAVLTDVTNTFRLKVESNGGRLATDFDADEDIVFGDQMHLTNVIFNLLDNAVKYKSAERPIEISVASSNQSGRLCITIQDNGIGIKRDDLKKIFEKFYRAHTGNRHDVKGFGLGLAYVKKVIDFHHGTIHADSTLGHGTTFVISLPLMNS